MSMDKDKQRIAIAEACGFKRESKRSGRAGHLREWICPDGTKWSTSIPFDNELPDFLNCLNAMHEAEKALPTIMEVAEYQHHLEMVTGPEGNPVWFATAAQRAEAFLRTLNLWTPTGEENE